MVVVGGKKSFTKTSFYFRLWNKKAPSSHFVPKKGQPWSNQGKIQRRAQSFLSASRGIIVKAERDKKDSHGNWRNSRFFGYLFFMWFTLDNTISKHLWENELCLSIYNFLKLILYLCKPVSFRMISCKTHLTTVAVPCFILQKHFKS